jgi:anaerobic ribonucleoside-triphosphate reductase activating protein
MLRVLNIVEGTSVDGPGLRTSIYFAGCHHQCPGCHNPQSWDPDGGTPMTVDEILSVVRENDFNVTFSGGDPLYQPLPELTQLAQAIRAAGYTLWCFTGFTYEQLAARADLRPLLSAINVLVDGPFIEAQRDISLLFRGSSNQRLIDLRRSTPAAPIPWSAS